MQDCRFCKKWDDDIQQTIDSLIMEGESYAQIAKDLGVDARGLSHHAVNCLGIKKRGRRKTKSKKWERLPFDERWKIIKRDIESVKEKGSGTTV